MHFAEAEQDDMGEESSRSASPYFEAQVKAGVIDPVPYDRLMIAYRKEKNYPDELRVIKRAIAVFGHHLKSVQKDILKGHRKRSSIAELSNSISRHTGLIDKKGNSQHIPEPIAKWIKRQTTVEQKIKAASKKKGAKQK